MGRDAIELFLDIAAGRQQKSLLVKPVGIEAPARIEEPVKLQLKARLDPLRRAFGTVAGFPGKSRKGIELREKDGAKLLSLLAAGGKKMIIGFRQGVEQQPVARGHTIVARQLLALFENAWQRKEALHR